MIDISIIQACINNNAAAQRELYNRTCVKLFSICFRYANSKEEAEDMLQEGYIKIFRNISILQTVDNVEAWMRRLMVNTCINVLKANKNFAYNSNIDNDLFEMTTREETIGSKILGKQVMGCLLQMPILYRTIINLHAIEGYTHKEIATMLNIEESTCRSRYARGKDLLENILKQKQLIPNDSSRINWLNILHS